tara:strand:+ start:41 stop:304 length:264 start_codon:yes stop_codon:yes gene_type:complete
MAYTYTSTLTSKNSNTYADVAAWIAEHGPCGSNYDTVTTSSLTLAEDGASVTRVLVYEDEAAKDAHFTAHAGITPTWNAADHNGVTS